jgi:FlaA1/EpsC-like NDP-sugar epimerase
VRDEANPHGDIEIVYVGLRPGEKLYEELFVGDSTLPTAHPRINMAKERSVQLSELDRHLEALRAATAARNAEAVRALLQELIAPDQGMLGGAAQARREAEDARTVH